MVDQLIWNYKLHKTGHSGALLGRLLKTGLRS